MGDRPRSASNENGPILCSSTDNCRIRFFINGRLDRRGARNLTPFLPLLTPSTFTFGHCGSRLLDDLLDFCMTGLAFGGWILGRSARGFKWQARPVRLRLLVRGPGVRATLAAHLQTPPTQ